MTDLKILFTDGRADLEIAGGDLVGTPTLETAVLISLFTDGRAGLEDDLPDDSGDRRGWWAANLLPTDVSDFGGLLWTLERSKLTTATLTSAENFATNALEWAIADDVAQEVNVAATRLGPFTMLVTVELVRGTATAFPAEWAAFADVSVETGPVNVKLVTR
jgi:phage gp46-like protein